MNEKDLNTLFDEAFANAQLIPQESVPQDMQLILYGLYKQATSETTTPLLFQNPQDIIKSMNNIKVCHCAECKHWLSGWADLSWKIGKTD